MTDFTTRLATSLLAAQTAPDGVAKFLGFSSPQPETKPMPKSTQTGSEPSKPKPEMVRVVIYGTEDGVEQIIREFYLCRFAAITDWGPRVPTPGKPREVFRTYTRRLR